MTNHFKKQLSIFIVPLSLTLATSSFALVAPDVCTSDAECATGSACEKSYYVEACSSDAAECDSTPHESETGTCVAQPVKCEADTDCGEYEACLSSSSGSCWASSNGESGCSEPDPDAAKYCSPASKECSQDSDCPREFECVETQTCPDIACVEGETCDLPACTPTGGQCSPKQIACDDDTACPTDWSCMHSTEYTCSGGGTMDGGGTDSEAEPTSSDSAGSADRPLPAPDYSPDVQCEVTERPGYCQPDAWGGGYGYAADGGGTVTGGDDKGEGQEAAVGENDLDGSDDSSQSDSGNGCSVAGQGPGAPGTWGWLLLGIPFLLRRRSASTSAS